MTTLRQKAFFELRYLIAAPITLIMLIQFAVLWWTFYRFFGERTKLVYVIYGIPATIYSIENFLYNTFVATFIFWDRPREFATSDRLRRYTYETPHEVYGVSRMANAVNYWDPNHI